MRYAFALSVAAVVLAVSACKPPPTDADLRRAMPEDELTFASDPLPSPESEGAVWASSPQSPDRIIYGIPGNPAQMALECIDAQGALPQLQITRLAPADEGAGAMLSLIGNGHIGRMEIDATMVSGRSVWQGASLAADTHWEPLAGPRQLTATVPGAGMVTLNRSPLPGLLIEACRNGESFDPMAAMQQADGSDDPPEEEASPLP